MQKQLTYWQRYRAKRKAAGNPIPIWDAAKRKAWAKRYYARAEVKAQKAEATAKHARKYPQQAPARREVARAIRSGLLVRQPCEVCGHQPAQAHHDNYSRPLDVRWLCRKHHLDLHRKPTK